MLCDIVPLGFGYFLSPNHRVAMNISISIRQSQNDFVRSPLPLEREEAVAALRRTDTTSVSVFPETGESLDLASSIIHRLSKLGGHSAITEVKSRETGATLGYTARRVRQIPDWLS